MNPTQVFMFAVGIAAQKAKKRACTHCGHVGLRPNGPPGERRDQEPRDRKLFMLTVKVPICCPVCGKEDDFLLRTWHRKNDGTKVVPAWTQDVGRN